MKDEFSKISDILNESAHTHKGFGQAFEKSKTCNMFFSFWKNIVGKKFEKLSIPYELKGSTLFVSVISPAVIQELSFFKKDIIEKCMPYADGLNLKITEIRFNYKNWTSIKASTSNKQNSDSSFDKDVPDYYTDKDYETIGLDNNEETEFNKLKETISKVESLPPHLKEKMYNNVLNQYKAKKLRDR